ncbi:hypothetical protein ACFLU6_15355, partial [Acidobacteriota bacterium]
LRQFVVRARQHQIELTVVVFPHLRDIEGTKPITARVAQFFRSEGVRAIDFGARLEGRDPMGLVVNSVDAHPNVALQKEIAQILMNEVFEPKQSARPD